MIIVYTKVGFVFRNHRISRQVRNKSFINYSWMRHDSRLLCSVCPQGQTISCTTTSPTRTSFPPDNQFINVSLTPITILHFHNPRDCRTFPPGLYPDLLTFPKGTSSPDPYVLKTVRYFTRSSQGPSPSSSRFPEPSTLPRTTENQRLPSVYRFVNSLLYPSFFDLFFSPGLVRSGISGTILKYLK